MPLLKPDKKTVKKYIRISIQESLLEETRAYCQWANIQKLDDFFALAAQFIFKKDKDWKNYRTDKS